MTCGDVHGAYKSVQAKSDHALHERHAGNHEPEFPSSDTGVRSLVENTPPGTALGDRGEAAGDHHQDVLSYSPNGTDSASFDIVRTSGQLLAKARLGYETRYGCSATARVAPHPASRTGTTLVN